MFGVLAVEGLVADHPLLGALAGLAVLVVAWMSWTYFPRYERQLQRIPGVYGRVSSTLFLAAIGSLTLILSVVEAAD